MLNPAGPITKETGPITKEKSGNGPRDCPLGRIMDPAGMCRRPATVRRVPTVVNACVFCGATAEPSREHVFGKWLQKIGLSQDPVLHVAGPLNRSPRGAGVQPPFRTRTRNVCKPCNSGWMKTLEDTANRVLTPSILGDPVTIAADDLPAIAAWAHKTTLVAMLVPPGEDRARGYGLPAQEYRELHALREQVVPLPDTQFWIGRYSGQQRMASAWAVPMVVAIDGLPEPDHPHAYAMTLLLGELLLQGIRFTTASLRLQLTAEQDFTQIWPVTDAVDWPAGTTVNDEDLPRVSKGLNLHASEPQLTLRPWRPATDLPDSDATGTTVRVPTPCGKHYVHYPFALVAEAARGRSYSFVTSCECGKAYLVRTEPDGPHFKAEGGAEGIESKYETLTGAELIIEYEAGTFVCKQS